MEESGWPQLDTGLLGGVDTITRADLLAMQRSQYVLHARGGRLTKVPVEKSLVPRDPKGHNQGVSLTLASDGTVYVSQATTMSKSEDGGRTWTAYPVSEGHSIQILADGTLVRVSDRTGLGAAGPAEVLESKDEGLTWQQRSEIPVTIPIQHHSQHNSRSLAP